MKTLTDHTLLYDEACPLCQAYTGAFVKGQWLDAQGRTAFTETALQQWPMVATDRAQDEIALINRKTGQVTYGLQSLFTIIAHRWPLTRPLFAWQPFRWAMQHLYKFVSFNRKAIVGDAMVGTCTPSFHAGYRWAYIVWCMLVGASALALAQVPGIAGLGFGLAMAFLLGLGVSQPHPQGQRAVVHRLGSLATLGLLYGVGLALLCGVQPYLPAGLWVAGLSILILGFLGQAIRRYRIAS